MRRPGGGAACRKRDGLSDQMESTARPVADGPGFVSPAAAGDHVAATSSLTQANHSVAT